MEYVNKKEGYRLLRPSAWEQTSKAGEKRAVAALQTLFMSQLQYPSSTGE